MSDSLQSGIEWLDSVRKAYMSQSVTYRRGLDEATIEATLGTSEEEVYDDTTSMRVKRNDFLITAEDLVIDGEETEPLPGDQIIHGTKTYEVMALADGRHYSVLPGGITLRIHAKLVDE